jgi:LysR family transcriptional regulator of abg operon
MSRRLGHAPGVARGAQRAAFARKGNQKIVPALPAVGARETVGENAIIAGRRGHPLHDAKSLRDLAQASWVRFASPGQRGLLARMFSSAGLPPPRIMVYCESYATGIGVLASTDALGILVPLLTERYAPSILEQIRIEDPVPSVTFGMFSRTAAPLAPAPSAMAAAVTETARQLTRSR